MAKLKVRLIIANTVREIHFFQANDWGALSRAIILFHLFFFTDSPVETMAAHRAQLLLTLLPTALAFGMQDVEPDIELLKVGSKSSFHDE